jgi:hypothetical protein
MYVRVQSCCQRTRPRLFWCSPDIHPSIHPPIRPFIHPHTAAPTQQQRSSKATLTVPDLTRRCPTRPATRTRTNETEILRCVSTNPYQNQPPSVPHIPFAPALPPSLPNRSQTQKLELAYCASLSDASLAQERLVRLFGPLPHLG